MPIVLASGSPRRQELIRLITDDWLICPADINETQAEYQTPSEYALSMAEGKALFVSRQCSHPVLGADTVVCLGVKTFGKPSDMEENAVFLRELSGKWHTVLTAITLCVEGTIVDSNLVTTRVKFCDLSEQDILQYVKSKDGLDKAGGYGIQGPAAKFIAGIDGCYYNVVGLPVAAVAELIRGHI